MSVGQRGLQSYHHAWLSAHPGRNEAWLAERMADGFHVHHIDGDHANDAPANLVLIDGVDHMRLHGMKWFGPIRATEREPRSWKATAQYRSQRKHVAEKRAARTRKLDELVLA